MEEIENLPENQLMKTLGLYAIYKGKEGSKNVVALRGINLDLNKGEFMSVVGPSGSGKSTLMRCLGGLQHPSAGIVNYMGTDITKLSEVELVPFRRKTVGFIFQEGNLLNTLSGFQNVVRSLRYSGYGYTESRKRADDVLSALGMKSRMNDLPHRLSGGERQRIAIGRAIATNPLLVIADEPTGNLDYATAEIVMNIFKQLHHDLDMSFLIVTHSQHIASFSERNLELRDGRFTGSHGSEVELTELEDTRSIIIDNDGSLVLPPEYMSLIEQYGNLWNFSLNFNNDQEPRLIASPAQTEEKLLQCPVCNSEINSTDFTCKSCGAKLKQ